MSSSPTFITPWPELLRPGTAASLLDMAESTFRCVWPILAAHFGLKVFGIAGPKFRRENLLAVFDQLQAKGLDICVDKSKGLVQVGDKDFPIGSSRTGRSGRGRRRGAS